MLPFERQSCGRRPPTTTPSRSPHGPAQQTSTSPRWDARRVAAHTFVAVVGGEIAGFADFLDDGLLDMLFVHPDHGRTGVGRALVSKVQQKARSAGLSTLHTHASRTARPAFERLGFRTIKERPDNLVGGRVVPNYEMQYDLA